ncbi:MAG: Trypsin-like peptidase domain [Candidatus Parcubacteria bacterium]|jgi:S1-C subfamily serine protease
MSKIGCLLLAMALLAMPIQKTPGVTDNQQKVFELDSGLHKKAADRFARITAKKNGVPAENGRIGSGVIIETNKVLTCYHVIMVDHDMYVNGFLVEKYTVDPANDLALLTVPTKPISTVQYATSIQVGEKIFSIGATTETPEFPCVGMIQIIEPDADKIWYDIHGIYGRSGGGVYDYAGNLVAINMETKRSDMGCPISIGRSVIGIRKFLKSHG